MRIIPARAGFTGGGGGWSRLFPGSSPLARGLRGARRKSRVFIGIIPARAGFTPSARDPDAVCRDHPRSRGVYRLRYARRSAFEGSSPLARGLPNNIEVEAELDGIIPARAGFTRSLVHLGPLPQDHPRSRGVYSKTTIFLAAQNGSSPLARGLRWGNYASILGRRIIPARAGFTPIAPPRETRAWDHPRSRGVYTAALIAAWRQTGSSPLARGLRHYWS